MDKKKKSDFEIVKKINTKKGTIDLFKVKDSTVSKSKSFADESKVIKNES